MMKPKSLLIILICVLFSCKNQKNDESKKSLTSFDKILKRALVNGYYEQINDDLGIIIYQEKIFVLSSSLDKVQNMFLLHFIKKDKGFVNRDFNFEPGMIKSSELNLFKNLVVIQKDFPNVDFESVRIGQYIRNDKGEPSNVWVRQIIKDKILTSSKRYKNEFKEQINLNILDEDFKKSLKTGKFFKNKWGDYILLSDTYIYFIVQSDRNLDDKFMLHFVKNDNTFENRSFSFSSKNFQDFLEMPYSKLRIARVKIPYISDQFLKIRIGQYNSEGNIWVQELIIREIEENELLKYNNEFLK
ncbi:hypothetical protein [Aquimarina rubra]|uniref:DUF4292 domain-containing protein n=1 Tax=Aquimarina rubra TaxID=1920033 RepID=A0ABW5LF88_9FLAO